MKEINIIMEGYNSNGICVACLSYNRKMLSTDECREILKLLGDINVPEGLTVKLCWECRAMVKKVSGFQKQINQSYNLLADYASQNAYLKSPNDLSKYSCDRLSVCDTSNSIFILEGSQPEVKVKLEDEVILEDLKVENETPGFEVELYKNESSDDRHDYIEADDTFVDEIPLVPSPLLVDIKKPVKHKKERSLRSLKERMKKKEAVCEDSLEDAAKKLLRSLPPDLATVCRVDESEMNAIRQTDVNNIFFIGKEFKCLPCIMSFKSEIMLKTHEESKHGHKPPKSVSCDICCRTFPRVAILEAHRKIHLQVLKCCKCSYTTSVREHMKRHINTHKGKCDVCKMEFESEEELRSHNTTCGVVLQILKCDCCNKGFTSKLALVRHIRSQSSDIVEKKQKSKTVFKCKICNKVFSSKKISENHAEIHKGHKGYPCQFCGKLLRWRSNMRRHLIAHEDKQHNRQYECRDCGKLFRSRQRWHFHMKYGKKHSGIQCDQCGEKFEKKQLLIDHIDWVHLKKVKYTCTLCNKSFQTGVTLSSHMKVKHGCKLGGELLDDVKKGKNLCEICGKTFTCKYLLDYHTPSHSDTPTFPCSTCGKAYKTRASLSSHKRSHLDRLYPCSVCGKTFNDPSNRTRHFKFVHTDVKNSECEHCGKCFKSDGDKKMHIKHVHLKEPWPKRVATRTYPRE